MQILELASSVSNRRDCETASFAAKQDTMYSASQGEVAAMVCFVDRQLTGQPGIMNTYTLEDILVSMHPPPSLCPIGSCLD